MACGNLGMMYEQGIGVDVDYEKSLSYFIKSANLGNADAMKQVSEMYYKGIGTEANEKIAKEWEKKSRDQGIHEEIEELVSAGNALLENKNYEEARNKYLEALKLVPEPKGSYYEMTWICAAIGDSYIENENYEEALSYYEEAYYSVYGKMNQCCFYLEYLGLF